MKAQGITKRRLRDLYNSRFEERHHHSGADEGRNVSHLSRYFCETLDSAIKENLKRGNLALNLGSGEGNKTPLLHRNFGNNIEVDVSLTALKILRRRFQNSLVICSDAALLPLKDNVFDFVLCTEVIEHIPARESANMIREMWRVLKPGGSALITTPNGWELRRLALELALRLGRLCLSADVRSLKARLLDTYLNLTGARCDCKKTLVNSGFTEHINILTPRQLKKQCMNGGLILEKTDFICITPVYQKPFQRYKLATVMLRSLESVFRKGPLKSLLLSGAVFRLVKIDPSAKLQ